MVLISVYAFWAILQAILILVVLSLVLYRHGRRARRDLADVSAQVQDLQQKGDISHYFTTEIKLTEGRLAALGEEKTPGAHVWLHLRLDYLRVEKDFAVDMGRDELFWPRLEERMASLVTTYCRMTTVEHEKADAQIGLLVGEQGKLLRELNSLADKTCTDPQRLAEFRNRLERMGRISGELTVCSGMLEEENDFLRKQVATLVI